MSCSNENFPLEVSIDFPLYESERGRYFIGQTPFLSGQDKHALAALINSRNSHRDIYLNAMTITNNSGSNISADFYLRSSFNNGVISNFVSCANTSILPEPAHKGEIKYLTTAAQPPQDGVPIFSRIVSPFSTLVVDGGQIILGPEQSIVIYLGDFLPISPNSIKVAFGWSEKDIHHSHHYSY